jgi:hypothetical protein
VKVTGDALALAVLFEARVEPRGDSPSLGPALAAVRPLPRPSPTPPEPPSLGDLFRRSPATLGAMCAAALVTGMGLLALISPRRRR